MTPDLEEIFKSLGKKCAYIGSIYPNGGRWTITSTGCEIFCVAHEDISCAMQMFQNKLKTILKY